MVEPQFTYPESQQKRDCTVPLGGKFSPVFEKRAKVKFKLGPVIIYRLGGRGGGFGAKRGEI